MRGAVGGRAPQPNNNGGGGGGLMQAFGFFGGGGANAAKDKPKREARPARKQKERFLCPFDPSSCPEFPDYTDC